IFELTHDPGNPHQTFGSLTQAIMQSHDPNYIELQRVCKKGGYIYAFYHVEFFNDGLLPADHLSVTFDLPAHLKALCANVNLWNVRGNKVKGRVQLSGKSLNALASSQVAKLSPKESNVGLIFNPVESVDGNNMQDPKRSKGFIEFSLQFDITAGTSPVTKFKLKNCKVNFNQDSYLITKYFMPEDQVNPLPKQVQSCRCSCPQ
ncbi:MAG TPA: hypothetical protein VJ508_10560, partial [Saprospiraceae bacterium]|nr:hypothetical protein [Saprospiraceae bacterium]